MKEHGFTLFVDCAFYPDAVDAESSAKAVRDTGLREQIRFSAGGDAFYVSSILRGMAAPTRSGFTVRAAVLLNQLGYVSVALDILRNSSFPPDRIEGLLRADGSGRSQSSPEASAQELPAAGRLSRAPARAPKAALRKLTCAPASHRASEGSAVAILAIARSAAADDAPPPGDPALSIELRWIESYEGESRSDVETGLLWTLSFLGAELPAQGPDPLSWRG